MRNIDMCTCCACNAVGCRKLIYSLQVHQTATVSDMNWPTSEDTEMLANLPSNKLLELFFLHVKNLWRVDGLYFLGIEEKLNVETATEIDANCWRIMGKIEARELKDALNLKGDLAALMRALKHTSWALYQIEKECKALAGRGLFRVKRCRTQETRIRKGLEEFPCRQVRLGYLKSFAEEFDPKIRVTCRSCPPERRTEQAWCEWEFTLRE